MTTGLPDEMIAERVRSGHTGDFELLVKRYEKLVFVISLRYTKDPAEAESVASEIFFAAYRGLSFYAGGSFKAWISRIAINKCNDWARKRTRETKNVISIDDYKKEIASGAPTPEEETIYKEDRRLLQKHIENLPEIYRRAAYYTFVQGKTAHEIAAIEHENQKTVETRIRRAKERLRDSLKEALKDGG